MHCAGRAWGLGDTDRYVYAPCIASPWSAPLAIQLSCRPGQHSSAHTVCGAELDAGLVTASAKLSAFSCLLLSNDQARSPDST